MYRLPSHAQKVIDNYENISWEEVVHLPVKKFDNNNIEIDDNNIISFGSSSYLGLHNDNRIIESGIEIIKKYGVIHSSSRSFTYIKELDEYEDLLSKIFNRPTLLTSQTTTSHLGAIPLLMLPTDIALVDSMAHATLQTTILIPKAMGLTVERVNHNDLEHLENKIKRAQEKGYEKIWYVCDSVYSMFGNTAPVQSLIALLDKYENFYIYFDDAHGMSWTGPNGAGYVWKYLPLGHDKVVMASSLSKGFGVGGGVLVCPNEKVKDWMKKAALNQVFCIQVPNQIIASGIACAKIHLSNEIYILQDKLKSNIEHFNSEVKKMNIPIYSEGNTPIFYVVSGSYHNGVSLYNKLKECGFYANIGIYPAVPDKFTGLRIAVNASHSKSEITMLLKNIQFALSSILNEKNTTIQDIFNIIPRLKVA